MITTVVTICYVYMILHHDTFVSTTVVTNCYVYMIAYLVLTLCGLALRSTRMTRPRVQRTSP